MKKVLEYLPLCTICLLYFGFCNLYYYYIEFGIDIYNYISSTEILLSFFPRIVIFSSTVYIGLIQMIFNQKIKNIDTSSVVEREEAGEGNVSRKAPNAALIFIAIFYAILVVGALLLTRVWHFRHYELQDWYLFASFLFLIGLLFVLKRYNELGFILNYSFVASLALVIFIGQEIGNYRRFDAERTKFGTRSIKEMSFLYNGHRVKTTDSLIFVGQTQNNIFLYDKRDSTSIMYKMGSIDSLTIK
ncbi:hypothetical protein [Chitinophaga sp. Ak27]|uniref:hypothetical protein n=1 Tax=Chitinophaga sp. Ak27 TaxID=2726116 RepID=UPI00145E3F7B|nr:hypothetical protein [Chitinophaga sp. Ak27]NLU93232.1 hypothetical protein [Chitinophaga sp. Ak27]